MGTLKLNKQTTAKFNRDAATQNPMEQTVAGQTQSSRIGKICVRDDGFIEELKDKRDTNSVVYRRNDRTCRKIISAVPLFYRDANGEYREIVNNLCDNGEEIVNGESVYDIRFDKSAVNGKIFDLQKGDKKLSLSTASRGKTKRGKRGCKCELCADAENTVSATLDDGTEIQYVAMNDRIKENIIVKEKQDDYTYDFTLNVGDLSVEEGEHNCLLLKDAQSGETQFTIPAPFMYDANGTRSDEVGYEIEVEGEELNVKVVASADFMNAEDRAFPVTIDPQIVVSGSDVFTYESHFWIRGDAEETVTEGVLQVYTPSGYEYASEYAYMYIDKTKIPTGEGIITNVSLRVTVINDSTLYTREGCVRIAGTDFMEQCDTYDVDITKAYQSADQVALIEFLGLSMSETDSRVRFYTSGVNAPVVTITYAEESGESENPYKELPLTDLATGYLQLNSGDMISAFPDLDLNEFSIPMKIAHFHRAGSDIVGYGNFWRLNLNKRLRVADDDTELTTKYLYTDEFGDNYTFTETYYYILGSFKIAVDKDKIKVDVNGNLTYTSATQIVYRVYKHSSCKGYTLIPRIDDFIDSDLIEQRQDEYRQAEEQVNAYKNTFESYVSVDGSGTVKERLSEKFVGGVLKKTDFDQFILTAKTYAYLVMTESEALSFNKNHTAYYEKQSEKTVQALTEAYVKYYNILKTFEQLERQTPINYLQDKNGRYSGFNKNGDLVCEMDGYGNYAMIVYDENGRIDSVYDSNDHTVSLSYNSYGMLESITDSRGRTVKYAYAPNSNYTIYKLDTVTFADGNTLTFGYSSERVSTVNSGNSLQARLTYTDNRLTRLINKAVSPRSGDISTYEIAYGDNSVTIEESGKKEKYTFYSVGSLKQYENYDSAKKGTATTYTHISHNDGKTVTAVTARTPQGDSTTVTERYDRFDLLTTRTEDWQEISATVQVKTVTEYTYDLNNLPVCEKTTRSLKCDNVITDKISIVNYSYNASGSLILTESYVEGEENTSGKNYEERVYDGNGNVIKTICWNSLDSSSKFYTESDVAENGQVLADKGETGEISAEYEYIDGTNVVNGVTYLNGSKFAYGRNPYNFEISSVTQSTDEGEANQTDIVYEYGLPVQVKSGNTVLEYEYDQAGRKKSVTVNGVRQADITYKDYSSETDGTAVYLTQTTKLYVDGKTVKAVYQKEGSTIVSNAMNVYETLTVGNDRLYRKSYDIYGNLQTVSFAGGAMDYTYDAYYRLTQVEYSAGTGVTATENYTYNGYGELTQKATTGAVTQTYTYAYKDNAARDLDYVGFETYKFYPLSDVNGRNTGREIYSGENKLAAEYITYRKVGDHATTMPSTVWFGNGSAIKDSIKYKYDSCGNIIEVRENGHVVAKYVYDALNRLVREDNKQIGKTVLFDYDTNGNIVERCEYDYTSKTGEELSEQACTHYSYDYDGDKLTNYNGESFAYNTLGNPTTYRNKAVTWQYGKYLAQLGDTTFTYDGLGRRIGKGEISFTYDSDGRLLKQSNGLEFIYDDKGVIGVKYNAVQYFYRKDAQGNIIAILDSNGGVVVKYVYDAWGNHAVVDSNGNDVMNGIGILNPFRYRGYYYDTETELYFLQTRYYDPEIGRFISQDSIEYADPETINGLNLYAYCGNNPVMNIDPFGNDWWSDFWKGVGNWFEKHWVEVVIGTAFIIGGAIITAFTCGTGTTAWAAFGSALLSSVVQVGVSVAISVGVNGLVNIANGNSFFYNVGDTIASSFMWAGIFAGGSQMLSGGFRFLRARTGYKGLDASKVGFMSPDKLYYDKPGMTLFRFGSRKGKKLALDFGRYGIHAHLFCKLHTPMIPIIVAFMEWFN